MPFISSSCLSEVWQVKATSVSKGLQALQVPEDRKKYVQG